MSIASAETTLNEKVLCNFQDQEDFEEEDMSVDSEDDIVVVPSNQARNNHIPVANKPRVNFLLSISLNVSNIS